ncbi:unnamed protein product [Lepeophtheirus salmonis]|uniref:(salmon louse) hypothetical protein n=1 Tax=Lepeophtheirus salmonis TaxID=72036 RepID=A0A7R8D1G2_LEPSM|nr:unnamed protein product [Lepeophtheirus salmonis]CAF2950237.1 unnamed protein product [Lepeophtheirus salmonis]
MDTHTISNTSTFRGWLESMGLDDILTNPCSCILGPEEPIPQPAIGRRRQQPNRASQKAVPEIEEPKSSFFHSLPLSLELLIHHLAQGKLNQLISYLSTKTFSIWSNKS